MNKNCKYCKTEFETNKKQKKFCSKQCRERDWLKNNRERANKNMREYRARRYKEDGYWRDSGPKSKEMKDWMIKIKSRPCTDCGNCFDVCCMDFDHKKGEVKEYNVGSMFAHHYSRDLIERELAKCELVCSNCHRIRTKIRRTGSGKHRNTTPV